ncbi:MAG: hypothetical protein ABS34_10845 [Opitutaceae bacterium BACL24 MAG-120322-bin51]|jgi:tRNA(fMet)-specific endonuclease VapC|nr:MAG: hypothetical protein ABS34_10845 [Opitutaceae bacterium BACL24 MAG-120322-bin51]
MKVGNLAVDTSAVISLFRGQKEALEHFNQAQEVWMPVTVLGELYCGLRKCNNPEKERLKISELSERCLIVGVDEGTAIRYAEIYSNLEEKGTMIPLNDIWIAAFAVRHEISLLARDSHFERIDGLNLIAL